MGNNGACSYLFIIYYFYFYLIADVNINNLYIIRAINQYLPIFRKCINHFRKLNKNTIDLDLYITWMFFLLYLFIKFKPISYIKLLPIVYRWNYFDLSFCEICFFGFFLFHNFLNFENINKFFMYQVKTWSWYL